MMEAVLGAIVAAPGLVFLALATSWLLGWTPPERVIARLTAIVFSAMTAAALWLAAAMIQAGGQPVRLSLGEWFEAGSYHFPLWIVLDRLSLPLMLMTVVLTGITGVFSVRYVHRERGFFRFFALLYLFTFGALLECTAGSYDLMFAGWELLGVTSVLLVAFFDERREPVRNALRVFATYRMADIGFLLALFVLHHRGTTLYHKLFAGDWPGQSVTHLDESAVLAGFLLFIAASGKSAQGPFAGWLPRAMEGPTPSSSIFYGAISIHAGAYLLLRSAPLIASSLPLQVAIVGIGIATAFLGTIAHRVASDAKTSLAYAAMTQVGIIFAEIGLGFPQLALFHMVGHAVVRTMQFLRAPSMLHDYHRIHAAAGGHLGKTGEHYEGFLPEGVRGWIYRFGLERGFYDAWLERLVILPVTRLSQLLGGSRPGRLPKAVPDESRSLSAERQES